MRRSRRREGRKSGKGEGGDDIVSDVVAVTTQGTTEAVIIIATIRHRRTKDSRSNSGSGPSSIWAASRRVGRGKGRE